MVVGLISDTHGLVRPQALHHLAGSDLILHAGDLGGAHVIVALKAVAPLVAIRGNVDDGAWAEALPERRTVDAGGIGIYMLHDVKQLEPTAPLEGIRVVLSGHSHKPTSAERNGILYVNPGSAGPKRFNLPITVARLYVDGQDVTCEIVEIVS